MTGGGRDVVVVGGVRTPFVGSGHAAAGMHPADLGSIVVREVVERSEIDQTVIDEVVVGITEPPLDSGNTARAIALEAKLPPAVPAFSVNRDDATGLQSVMEAALRIRAGEIDLAIAASVESMSSAPLVLPRSTREIWNEANRSKGYLARAVRLSRLRPRHLKPSSARTLADEGRLAGPHGGQVVETLAGLFGVSREEQDRFALRSHRLAAASWEEGSMSGEVIPVPVPPLYEIGPDRDEGIRKDLSGEDLERLRPVIDPRCGTVTAGNSAPPADGAVALILASGSRATELGLPVLGRICSWAFTGCVPESAGLGPVFSTAVALERAGGLSLERVSRVEIDEAFAAQVLICLRAFSSVEFCKENLGRSPLGEIDPDRVNVNGGAIAIGRPVAATGARMLLTLLREMARGDLSLGLATIGVNGGQGATLVVERS